jgi:hypothetical protein
MAPGLRLLVAVTISTILSPTLGCIGGDGSEAGGGPAPEVSPAAPDPAGKAGMLTPAEAGDPLEKVYYGTPAPTHVPLTAGQVLAIGKFYNCSGLLITPTWVLTASHCGLRGGVEFCVGHVPDRPHTCVRSRRVVDNPRGDQSLVELSRDAREVAPGIEPVPILTEAMDSSWIRRRAEAAGYGQDERGGYGRRAFTAEPIVGLWGDTLTIDGEGARGVCFGDSGGPVMVIAGDGSARVAGNLSNGDGSCMGRDNYTRVDTYRDWIEGYTGPTQPLQPGAEPEEEVEEVEDIDEVESPCGDLDYFGRCVGTVAEHCKDDERRRRDCADDGMICDHVNDELGYWCLDPSECGALDFHGRCDGDVARWCDRRNRRTERDCRHEGRACAFVDNDIGFYCVDDAQAGGGGDPAADADGDGVPNGQDLCRATEQGSLAWQHGEWIGCAGGQFRD